MYVTSAHYNFMFMSTFTTAFQFISSQTNKMSEHNSAGTPTEQSATNEMVRMRAQRTVCDKHPKAV
jgi:hypothetical protein